MREFPGSLFCVFLFEGEDARVLPKTPDRAARFIAKRRLERELIECFSSRPRSDGGSHALSLKGLCVGVERCPERQGFIHFRKIPDARAECAGVLHETFGIEGFRFVFCRAHCFLKRLHQGGGGCSKIVETERLKARMRSFAFLASAEKKERRRAGSGRTDEPGFP